MMGFMGMNMAQTAGGLNANALYQMNTQQPAAAPASGWKCSCGAVNTGKFCTQCGAAQGWTCACGAVNTGKFCPECGARKPTAAPLYRCDKCGYQPEDPHNPPKFCPECGDRFDDGDVQ
jgi:membrane protease subunit (stomatin/prohibitin family)